MHQMLTLPKSPALNAIAEILFQADHASRSQSPCKPSRLQRFSTTISPNGLSSPHTSAFYSSSSESVTKPHVCPVTPQMVSRIDPALLRFSFADPSLVHDISRNTQKRFCSIISTRTSRPPPSFSTSPTSPSPLTKRVTHLTRSSKPTVQHLRTSGHSVTRSPTTSCPSSETRIDEMPRVRLN